MNNQLTMRERVTGTDAVTSCLQTRRELQRYLDGETDPELSARISRHLAACRACGLEAEAYRSIKQALASGRTAPPPDCLVRLAAFAQALTAQP